MNCRIRTQKNGITVRTYAGLNNFFVKVEKENPDKGKILPVKMDGTIVDTWLKALDKHREYCGSYLLPSELEKNTE